MASRGFEFAYSLDGSTPLIKDWPMAASAAGYAIGDCLVIDGNMRADKAAAGATEVLGICQEYDAVTANDDLLKIAIVTPGQVWKCSMDAVTGYLNGQTTINLADENTIDADNAGAGRMKLVDKDTDNDGNTLAYVMFADCVFGA
jgi:hypothetical protein